MALLDFWLLDPNYPHWFLLSSGFEIPLPYSPPPFRHPPEGVCVCVCGGSFACLKRERESREYSSLVSEVDV